MGGARRIPSSDPTPSRLWVHPAWTGWAGTGRALSNLRDEASLLRALAGAMAGLAALEVEGRDLPPFSRWALGTQDLPVLTGGWEGGGAAPLSEHLAGFGALFGARPSKVGAAPVLPRRHPHSAVLGAWLGRWSGRAAGARAALVDLLELLGEAGCPPVLPVHWALAAHWAPPSALAGLGLRRLGASTPLRQMALRAWCLARGGRWVEPSEAAPYPYACLEPLVREACGLSAAESARWLGERLADPRRLSVDFTALLGGAEGGWVLRLPGPLDPASEAVLAAAAVQVPGPVLLLEEGAPAAGRFEGLRVLTLPECGEDWWLRQGRAVVGEDDPLLEACARPGAPLPRPGAPLLPQVPAPRRLEEPPELPGGGPAWAARAWRHAAAREAASDPSAAALWRARAHLATGQAVLAQPHLEIARASAPAEVAVLTAKAHDRFLDFPAMRDALSEVTDGGSPSAHPAEVLFLRGHATWLCGDMGEGLRLLEAARAAAADADVLVLGLTGLATARLHLGEAEAARELLSEAEAALPRCRRPLPRIVFHHRQGLWHVKGGRYLEAVAAFERAAALSREAWDHRFEAIAHLEAGAALHLAYRYAEARERLRRAEEGFSTLGLGASRDCARFDHLLCDVESGRLVEAQASLEASLPRCAPGRDRAVERYWLARVLELRGEPVSALGYAEAGLAEVQRFSDPALRAPLVILRSRLLLSVRDYRRLGFALRECRRLLESAPDPDDRLDAASVLLEASVDRHARAAPPDAALAAAAAREAQPGARCRWALARARAGEAPPEAPLGEALALAGEVRDPALETEVLAAMEARGVLPELDRSAAERVATFVKDNRIRTAPRRLLGSLVPQTPAPLEPEAPAPLRLLERALEGTLELGPAARAAGSVGAVLLRVGAPPVFSGELEPAVRAALLAAAGRPGGTPAQGLAVECFEGRGGTRAAFAWAEGGAPQEGRTFARLFAALLPPTELPPTPREERGDPILERLLLGRSEAMASLRRVLAETAPFSFPVLLTGEPGVGKEACARGLHELSPRARRPWVPANCANLSPTLAASLLFGHRRGAFTGADRDSPGLVEVARGGTLFLDEVGELPAETQAQLLRFLQDGTYTPLGEGRPRTAEVRVVAATNRDLEGAVASGSFRPDLFHRLNVIRVEIPPLRARAEDIPQLFGHFLAEAARAEGRPTPQVEDSLWGPLLAWPWPGNVRELQNLARALLVRCSARGRICGQDLPRPLAEGAPGPREGGGLRAVRERAERAAMEEALRRSGGNVSAAARALGITRQALARRLGRGGPAKPHAGLAGLNPAAPPEGS